MIKALKILGLFVLVFAAIFILMTARNLYLVRTGGIVKWDNKWYTKKELAEKFPPQYYEVEAKNTPEEAYAGFRQALLENDIEKALEHVVEEKRELFRQVLQEKKDYAKWLNSLPDEIIKESESENLAVYYYLIEVEFDKIGQKIGFVKNRDGYWEIYYL